MRVSLPRTQDGWSLNPQTSSSYVHCQASGATTAHPLQKRARSYCAMIVQREERA